MDAKREAEARKILKKMRLNVEAVAFIKRFEDEFAAIVCPRTPGFEDIYERALEVLTDPRCVLEVVREHIGRHDIRIYVQFAKAV